MGNDEIRKRNDSNYKELELILFGIDKKWVRSSKGEWIEKKDQLPAEENPTENITEEAEIILRPKRASWMFWKSK